MADKTKPEYTREEIQRLHAENFTDLYIADLFGKTELEISRARKKSSYWEELNAPPVAESSTEESAASEEKEVEKPPKGDKKKTK